MFLDKNKVVLGLSGGVDSTIAALLLKEKGYDVYGLYFDIAEYNEHGKKAAMKVAEETGIHFTYKNVKELFSENVIENFCSEYVKGRTPNPCIVCNPLVKFRTLKEYADETGAYYIATGHYGSTYYDEASDTYYLKKTDNAKDQTYMLYRLGQDVIKRFIMPLESFENKELTRKMAVEHNLSNAEEKDSQEICFIPEDKTYIDFLKEKGFTPSEGDFISCDGHVLGRHKGIVNYTVGQRKGLGVTFGKPMFVLGVDHKKNTVTLGDNDQLFNSEVYSSDNFFTIAGGSVFPEEYEGKSVMAKIRYAARPAEAVIVSCGDGVVKTVFKEPQRAATPGQSIVFYCDDILIGGGFIF